MKSESWKDIEGFKGSYMVSNIGRVRSLDRFMIDKSGRRMWFKERVLKPSLNQDGYYKVALSSQCKRKMFFVHRLVSFAFIDNPHNKKEVNHINGIKTDNRVENLEWATPKENVRHAFDTGLNSVPLGKDHPRSKSVVQISFKGIIIKEHGSVSGASRATGIHQDSISNAARGVSKTAGGFIWYYSSELTNRVINGVLVGAINHTESANCKKVGQFDLDGNLIRSFRSVTTANKTIDKTSMSGISGCIHGKNKTSGGFKWRLL